MWQRDRRSKLLRPILRGAAVALLALGGWQAVAWLSGPRNGVRVEPSSTFACLAREGDVVIARFTLRNVTRSPVRVMGAEASCGCMIARGLPVTLDPGEAREITLRVVVGPRGRTGPSRRAPVCSWTATARRRRSHSRPRPQLREHEHGTPTFVDRVSLRPRLLRAGRVPVLRRDRHAGQQRRPALPGSYANDERPLQQLHERLPAEQGVREGPVGRFVQVCPERRLNPP